MESRRNLFSWIVGEGSDKNFEPNVSSFDDAENFEATDALAGSNEKIKVLADRIEMGMPLWHPEDPSDPFLPRKLQDDDD